MQLDAGFLGYTCNKLCAVLRVADSGGGYGDGFVCLIDFAHIGKAFHCFDGAAEGFLGQQVFVIDLLAQAQCLLLIIDHIIRAVFIEMADN